MKILCVCDEGFDRLSEQLRSKIRVEENGCWQWTAALNAQGYGHVTVCGKTRRAGRLIYEQLIGPIPDGLQLDHLCRNRGCVSPHHVEPVTSRENTMRGDSLSASKARQTHCKRGHEFNEANTYRRKDGTRMCRVCHRIAERARTRHEDPVRVQ